MKAPELFRERLKNIMNQLSSDQQEELMEKRYGKPEFQPKGYPRDYKEKGFNSLSDEEVKFLHDIFIEIQYSEEPLLQGEDIRGVSIYPYKD